MTNCPVCVFSYNIGWTWVILFYFISFFFGVPFKFIDFHQSLLFFLYSLSLFALLGSSSISSTSALLTYFTIFYKMKKITNFLHEKESLLLLWKRENLMNLNYWKCTVRFLKYLLLARTLETMNSLFIFLNIYRYLVGEWKSSNWQ